MFSHFLIPNEMKKIFEFELKSIQDCRKCEVVYLPFWHSLDQIQTSALPNPLNHVPHSTRRSQRFPTSCRCSLSVCVYVCLPCISNRPDQNLDKSLNGNSGCIKFKAGFQVLPADLCLHSHHNYVRNSNQL